MTLLLSGCGIGSKSTYRFRMTVEVETPAGAKTGSSVFEVMARNTPGMDPSGLVRENRLRGEAVAVDIPGGKTLFAILKSSGGEELALISMATLDPAFKNDWVESARRISDRDGIQSPAEMAPENYPLLAVFNDIADPKSVKKIDPADLATIFGSGVRLKRITVEVTSDAVTTGIEKRLEWLGQYYSKRLDGQRFGDGSNFANSLSSGVFSTEAAK